jgi:two-component system, cell cycle response regulator DivK
MSVSPATVVLIVDDNEKNMKLARDVLHLAGFATLEACTGRESIEVAATHVPHVILMDIRLPDMDGTDAARAIKADPRTAAIPIVALTSLAMKGDRELLLAAGFDGYLEKPISVREFPDQVRAFCGTRPTVPAPAQIDPPPR